jgi:hypothetical protein
LHRSIHKLLSFHKLTMEHCTTCLTIKSKHNIEPYYNTFFASELNKSNNKYNDRDVTKDLQTYNSMNNRTCIDDLIVKLDIEKTDDYVNDAEQKLSSSDKSIFELLGDNYKSRNHEKRELLNTVYSALFIPINVIHWIEMKGNKQITVNYKTITIVIVYEHEDFNLSSFINHLLILYDWLMAINQTYKKHINAYIYLCDIAKQMNDCSICETNDSCSTCKILTKNNINSGVSYSGNWIQIFRKEEIIKVYIHELIHHIDLDIKNNAPSIDRKINSMMKMGEGSLQIYVNESYTELLTIYLHTMYVVFMNDELNSTSFHKYFIDETLFTIYQINKIFSNYGIEDISYFRTSNTFVQRTNVLSYFLIKYLFMTETRSILSKFDNIELLETKLLNIVDRLYELQINKCSVNDNGLRMTLYDIM